MKIFRNCYTCLLITVKTRVTVIKTKMKALTKIINKDLKVEVALLNTSHNHKYNKDKVG